MVSDQIRAVLAAKADALVQRSAGDLAALIHADFVYVNSSGRMFDKAGYIANATGAGRIVFHEQKVSDLDVRPFDGFAVATMILHDSFSVDGRNVVGTFRSLCVFSQVDGRWQWIAGQTMTVPAA
jgi:hypothetical protein